MSERDQIAQLETEIDKLVDRFRAEYDITYAATIGTLQLKIHRLSCEAVEQSEE